MTRSPILAAAAVVSLSLLRPLPGVTAPAPPAPPAAPAAAQTFGKPLAGLDPVKLEAVLAKPENGRAVRLEGSIDKVCQNKGCWLELKQGDRSVHVTFEGYSFFVPKDSTGKKVVLEGRLKVEEPSADEVKHLQSEGAGEAAARKVTVVATGVEIRDADPSAVPRPSK